MSVRRSSRIRTATVLAAITGATLTAAGSAAAAPVATADGSSFAAERRPDRVRRLPARRQRRRRRLAGRAEGAHPAVREPLPQLHRPDPRRRADPGPVDRLRQLLLHDPGRPAALPLLSRSAGLAAGRPVGPVRQVPGPLLLGEVAADHLAGAGRPGGRVEGVAASALVPAEDDELVGDRGPGGRRRRPPPPTPAGAGSHLPLLDVEEVRPCGRSPRPRASGCRGTTPPAGARRSVVAAPGAACHVSVSMTTRPAASVTAIRRPSGENERSVGISARG